MFSFFKITDSKTSHSIFRTFVFFNILYVFVDLQIRHKGNTEKSSYSALHFLLWTLPVLQCIYFYWWASLCVYIIINWSLHLLFLSLHAPPFQETTLHLFISFGCCRLWYMKFIRFFFLVISKLAIRAMACLHSQPLAGGGSSSKPTLLHSKFKAAWPTWDFVSNIHTYLHTSFVYVRMRVCACLISLCYILERLPLSGKHFQGVKYSTQVTLQSNRMSAF